MNQLIRSIFVTLIAAVILSAAHSCSCSRADESTTPVHDKYLQVYQLGQENARHLLEDISSYDDRCDYLLEIRARQHHIEVMMTPQHAEAFVVGFEQYIIEHDEDLARDILIPNEP